MDGIMGLAVTDHACLRFLNRGLGMDIPDLKSEILGKLGNPPSLLDGKYPMEGGAGLVAVVKANRIVTIQKGC